MRKGEPIADAMLTPRQVADRLSIIKVDVVLQAIHSGALIASNVSAGTSRPTWRIAPADLAAFLENRRAVPAPKPAERRPRRRVDTSVHQYF